MKAWMAAWTVGAVVASTSAVSAQSAQEVAAPLTVKVHVTDYAKLSAKELATAEAQATAAYRMVGLDLIWSSVPPGPEAGDPSVSPSIEVHVVIVPRDMADKKCHAQGLGDSVMGTAINGATEARGRIAYIFYHRIERIAVSQQAPIARGLGHVMAHEVGHLLIGENSHSDEGLMQPNWNPREGRAQTFTPSQVQQIRRRFMTPL
jgi:hypothetical protein